MFAPEQHDPKTSSAQFTFTHVVPTPNHPPNFGRHSHEYVTTQFATPKQHAPHPQASGHGSGVQVTLAMKIDPAGHGGPLTTVHNCVVRSQHTPAVGCGGGQGLGAHEPLGIVVQFVGHVEMSAVCWQFPVAGSQHAPGNGQALTTPQVVPAGSGVPPASVQNEDSTKRHRPQQQHASVGDTHPENAHGVPAAKPPPSVAQFCAVVKLHPPGRQHAPKTVTGEHGETGVQPVPTPWKSPPLIEQKHWSSGTHSPLEKQHAPTWHGGGHGFGAQVLAASVVQPSGHCENCWQFPLTGSQHTLGGGHGPLGTQANGLMFGFGLPPPSVHRSGSVT